MVPIHVLGFVEFKQMLQAANPSVSLVTRESLADYVDAEFKIFTRFLQLDLAIASRYYGTGFLQLFHDGGFARTRAKEASICCCQPRQY